MTRRRTMGLMLSALAAFAAAWATIAVIRGARSDEAMLAAIVSENAGTRGSAWRALLRPAQANSPRAEALAEPIHAALAGAPDEALLDAGMALRTVDRWRWDVRPRALMLRELELRAAGPAPATQLAAADELMHVPLDLPQAEVMPLLDRFLGCASAPARLHALQAACAWLGLHRTDQLADLEVPADDVDLRGARDRAVRWAARPLVISPSGQAEPERGDALLALAMNGTIEPWRRRAAAWGIHNAPEAQAAAILDGHFETEADAFTAAMLAERLLTRDRAAALALSWIDRTDDSRKQAGALLATLLGEARETLAAAYARETAGPVRTTQRMALGALGAPLDDNVSWTELAYRALHGEGGEFDPEAVLCLLSAGRAEALAWLTTPPRGEDLDALAASVQQRAWLIERFVPSWHRLAPPLAPDSPAPFSEVFADLETLRWLTERRLKFDPARRAFVQTDSPQSEQRTQREDGG